MTSFKLAQQRASKLNKELTERGVNNYRYIVGILCKATRVPINCSIVIENKDDYLYNGDISIEELLLKIEETENKLKDYMMCALV